MIRDDSTDLDHEIRRHISAPETALDELAIGNRGSAADRVKKSSLRFGPREIREGDQKQEEHDDARNADQIVEENETLDRRTRSLSGDAYEEVPSI